MVVKIVPNDKGNPQGKLADAELHFSDGVLEGLKLIGPRSDVSGMAAEPIALDRAEGAARLVLVDGTELAWQRARYREGRTSSHQPIPCS